MKVTILEPRAIQQKKKKVCAYARVSTGSESQGESLENQIQHYEKMIESNPEYDFVGVFADRGYTGTKKERPEFQKMIELCREGKIDLILTKSVSRLARNTTIVLEYVRELKLLGVEIYFENENIRTLSKDGELMLAVFSSFAEEESRSTSENIKWHVKKKFERGEPIINTSRFLGYDKDEYGDLVINEEEAKIVKRIFEEYLKGTSCFKIAKMLNEEGIPTVTGAKWGDSQILSTLKNEKYKGDVILQKYYRPNHLCKRNKRNTGQKGQYYIHENHIPIISKEMWDRVQEEIKKRVAAYCRVSTDQEEQLNSYEAQVSYYTKYIQNNPLYENAGIYADEGISGTNTKKREQFNKMIAACEAGKIDLIITKSISRFARNTLDCLNYVRHLKELGGGIIFEKENIDTLDAKGEVLLTILSSLAQDESRSISENSTWGIRRRFEQGKISINEKKFLGYEKDEDGNLIIDDKQAKVVRHIYKEYLDGKGTNRIAKELEAEKVKGPTGSTKWYQSTVLSILQNEKYKSEALLQKSYTKDFLNKTRVENNGEVRQYYVHESHPAIVDIETWEAVQIELDYASPGHAFCGRIICAKCNHAYGRKTWMSTEEKYKKITWVCNNRCGSKHIDDIVLKEVSVTSFNTILDNKDYFLQKWKQGLEQGDLLKQYRLKELMGIVEKGQKIEEFDEDLFLKTVEQIIVVDGKKKVIVRLLDGTEIECGE